MSYSPINFNEEIAMPSLRSRHPRLRLTTKVRTANFLIIGLRLNIRLNLRHRIPIVISRVNQRICHFVGKFLLHAVPYHPLSGSVRNITHLADFSNMSSVQDRASEFPEIA